MGSVKSRDLKYSDKSAGQPELLEIFLSLKKIMIVYGKGNFVVKSDKPGHFELDYGQEIELKGKKYPGLCFASLLVQKGYVGFYFFPVYIDALLKYKLNPRLLKTLKGKTCFHIKKGDPDTLREIKDALQTGYEFYRSLGWI